MIISEVNSTVDLVLRAASFANQLQDGWYRGSAEVDFFRDQVLMLTQKHYQWSAQLRRHGLSEDVCLLQAVQAAVQVLETQEKYVKRLQKSPFLRFRRKAFPGQLSYSLNRILAIVDAGPQLLAGRVTTYDLMERSRAQSPAPLPFIADSNYVPISECILEIRKTLEDEGGPRVVTLFGGPGLGKSSMVKYLALHYDEEKRRSIRGTQPQTVSFPDGVFYLFCGKGARDSVRQLQVELLECLGFGAGSAAPPDDSAGTEVLEAGYLQVPSHQMKLRSRLAEQKLLIVLDDVWEREVLQQLLVPAKGVKYLITSQMREIWGPAARIRMRNPTMGEARQIMSNYTIGLPVKGKFPENIKIVTDAVIGKLDRHPLSLADIGSSINSGRATDESHWKAISDNIQVVLDDNDQIQRSAVVYDQPYNLTVKASMMLMVESLHPEAQRLLFLIALLGGQHLPEAVVRYFYKLIHSHQKSEFLLKYNIQEKYLEERSLVELYMQPGRHSTFSAHGLRMDYIRENRTLEVRSIASDIIARTDAGGAELIQMGDAESTLVTILSAIYFTKPYEDAVVHSLENHWRILNDGVIPRSINCSRNPLDLVRSTFVTEKLVSLLNVDDEDHAWKQQAHEYAKKIIIKLACQGKLDDHSMARLLQLHQSTWTGCGTLDTICLWSPGIIESHFDENKKTFSSTHGETMETLLILLQDDATPTNIRLAAAHSLISVLDFESHDTIVNVASKFIELQATDSNPTLQTTLLSYFASTRWATRSVITAGEFTDVLEVLMGLLVFGKHCEVRDSAGATLHWFCQWRCIAWKIAVIPCALDNLFHLFLSKESLPETPRKNRCDTLSAGYILGALSYVEEIRVKFRGLKSGLDGLANILARIVGTWRYISEKERGELEERASIAAGILGELGWDKELRGYICSLPGLEDGLLFLQTIEMARLLADHPMKIPKYDWISTSNATRALAILYANYSNPTSRDAPNVEHLQEVFSCDESSPTEPPALADLYCRVHWTRVLVHVEMGAYQSALENLEVTQHHLDQILNPSPNLDDAFDLRRLVQTSTWSRYTSVCPADEVLSTTRIFLQAMLEDHARSLLGANKRVERLEERGSNLSIVLTERGIVKRLAGDLQGAVDDLNAAYQQKTYRWTRGRYDILKHRGYVKHLMEDDVGAKEDAEAAQKLKLEKIRVEETIDCRSFWDFSKLSLNYLGYSL